MKTADPDPSPDRLRLLKLQEACDLASASVATLRRAIRLGRLPIYRIGRRALRVSEADLLTWLAGCRRARH